MKALAVLAVLLSAATTSGCGEQSAAEPAGPQPVYQDPNNADYSEKHILLSDGRVVTCLEWMSGSTKSDVRGGISCDWMNAEGTE